MRRPCRIAVHQHTAHSEQDNRAVPERRRRAQRYQRIHVRRTVQKAPRTAHEKSLIDEQDRPRQEQFQHAQRQRIPCQRCKQRPSPHHMSHGYIHQGQEKGNRCDQARTKAPDLSPVRRHVLCRTRMRFRIVLRVGTVSCRLHRMHDLRTAHLALNAHIPGEQIHRAALNAIEPADRLFYARRACCTAHAGHLIFFPAHSRFYTLLSLRLFPYAPAACSSLRYFISLCSVAISSSAVRVFPSRRSSATQVRIWFPSSSRRKAFKAAPTAAVCIRMSIQ